MEDIYRAHSGPFSPVFLRGASPFRCQRAAISRRRTKRKVGKVHRTVHADSNFKAWAVFYAVSCGTVTLTWTGVIYEELRDPFERAQSPDAG